MNNIVVFKSSYRISFSPAEVSVGWFLQGRVSCFSIHHKDTFSLQNLWPIAFPHLVPLFFFSENKSKQRKVFHASQWILFPIFKQEFCFAVLVEAPNFSQHWQLLSVLKSSHASYTSTCTPQSLFYITYFCSELMLSSTLMENILYSFFQFIAFFPFN